jgi:hypothetical protein
MLRTALAFAVALALGLATDVAIAQQPQQQPPPRTDAPRPTIGPGDELKLDESGVLKASAIQSRMSAILANFALLQRQAQDLQTEMTRALEERKRLIEEAARKARVDVREPTEWVFDESGQRYVRQRK